MTYQDYIYSILEQKKMNQSAVARAAGLNPKEFNAMLRGRKLIRMEDVNPICRALEVTPNELFGYKED